MGPRGQLVQCGVWVSAQTVAPGSSASKPWFPHLLAV